MRNCAEEGSWLENGKQETAESLARFVVRKAGGWRVRRLIPNALTSTSLRLLDF